MKNEPFMNVDGGIHEIPLPITSARMWLCGKHFIGPKPDVVRAEHNNATVVCLVQKHELVERYDNYIEWHANNSTNTAIWNPIDDLSYPPIIHIRLFLDNLTERLHNGESLIIHCAAGIGRAGTTAIAVLMLLGMDMEEAKTHVRAHRPMAGPEAGSQQFALHELAQQISNQGR